MAVLTLSACELQETSVTDVEDVLVVEAIVQIPLDRMQGPTAIRVFMHRTQAAADGIAESGAQVSAILPNGRAVVPERANAGDCAVRLPAPGRGTCYLLEGPSVSSGDTVELEIEAVGGERLYGKTILPDRFQLLEPGAECLLEPETLLPITWTSSENARAYVTETDIIGLPDALEPLGIEANQNPLSLLGLSISATDTTTVFPSEFGITERFDLDRDLSLYLQDGLPPGSWAVVSVAAVDLNYVNWARPGKFNPSGTVRVPSVTGDGTGFFGSGVYRHLDIRVNPDPQGGSYPFPPC